MDVQHAAFWRLGLGVGIHGVSVSEEASLAGIREDLGCLVPVMLVRLKTERHEGGQKEQQREQRGANEAKRAREGIPFLVPTGQGEDVPSSLTASARFSN